MVATVCGEYFGRTVVEYCAVIRLLGTVPSFGAALVEGRGADVAEGYCIERLSLLCVTSNGLRLLGGEGSEYVHAQFYPDCLRLHRRYGPDEDVIPLSTVQSAGWAVAITHAAGGSLVPRRILSFILGAIEIGSGSGIDDSGVSILQIQATMRTINLGRLHDVSTPKWLAAAISEALELLADSQSLGLLSQPDFATRLTHQLRGCRSQFTSLSRWMARRRVGNLMLEVASND